jgi:predicted dehydrogenase
MTAGPKPPRIALIGISGYGRIHLHLARECRDRGEVTIVAAAVINPIQEADNVAELRAHGCAVYSDYEEMLRRHAGEIDLCLVPTGIYWHARMSIAALQAGANVLVEKPLAASMAEVAAVQEAERATGRFVALGFQDCYDPGTMWLADALRAGAIGTIESVRFLGIWPRARSYYLRNNWAGRLSVDGAPVLDSPLNNAFAHFVMLSLLFSGFDPEGTEVKMDGVELWRAHAIESFDTGVVTFRNRQGVRLWFGVSHTSHEALEPEIVIAGSAGCACWRYENEAALVDAGGRQQRRAIPDQHATRREMMEAVLLRLRDPQAPICTTAMAARHTAVIEAIHRATAIATFPPALVEWTAALEAAEAVPRVPGLDAALRRACASQQLLRDSGFSLASGMKAS